MRFFRGFSFLLTVSKILREVSKISKCFPIIARKLWSIARKLWSSIMSMDLDYFVRILRKKDIFF